MRKRHHRPALITEINITPFTDVILVLLIIFMIATPLISQSRIEVKLPEVSSEDPIKDLQPVYIAVTTEGLIYLGNKLLTSAELRSKLDRLVEIDANLAVIVAADQTCRFKDVVNVIDILKESGVKTLNIATKAN